jgi:phospholipid/cholesterol/gamma-HCH transport system substrate-binding protein
MIHQIRKYTRDFVAIILLGVFAAAVAGYILSNERLRFPIFQAAPYKLKANFSTGQAVTPGQGQTVRVSGVRIGDISAVDLHNGIATITMEIDPEYKDLVHTNATALLRPKTGLKDMFIELNPGNPSAPVAKQSWAIPMQNTLPDVNPDEVLSLLDGDTRDYLRLLISGGAEGLKGRGVDLRNLLHRFEPTTRDLARINGLLSTRHQNLSHLIHSLNLLNAELASKGPQLSELISASSTVFRAFASEQSNLSRAVGLLPGALHQTTVTLGKVQTYANVLGPTADRLRPAVRSLDVANHAIIPFARQSAPILASQIRPFVREARPLVRDLGPAATNLANASPQLTRTFGVLNHLFNYLGYNPGQNGHPNADGLLFWLAWLAHNGNAVFGTADANGPWRALTITAANCSSLNGFAGSNPGLGAVFAPALANPAICGGGQP